MCKLDGACLLKVNTALLVCLSEPGFHSVTQADPKHMATLLPQRLRARVIPVSHHYLSLLLDEPERSPKAGLCISHLHFLTPTSVGSLLLLYPVCVAFSFHINKQMWFRTSCIKGECAETTVIHLFPSQRQPTLVEFVYTCLSFTPTLQSLGSQTYCLTDIILAKSLFQSSLSLKFGPFCSVHRSSFSGASLLSGILFCLFL